MSESSDMAFCDGCEYRGEAINGIYCARSGMDFSEQLFGNLAGRKAFVFGDPSGETEIAVEELSVSSGSESMLAVLACIDQVSTGGEPIMQEGDF